MPSAEQHEDTPNPYSSLASPVANCIFCDFRPPFCVFRGRFSCPDLGPRGRPGGGGGGWGRTRYRRHAIGQERSHENIHAAGEGDMQRLLMPMFLLWLFPLKFACSIHGQETARFCLAVLSLYLIALCGSDSHDGLSTAARGRWMRTSTTSARLQLPWNM